MDPVAHPLTELEPHALKIYRSKSVLLQALYTLNTLNQRLHAKDSIQVQTKLQQHLP